MCVSGWGALLLQAAVTQAGGGTYRDTKDGVYMSKPWVSVSLCHQVLGKEPYREGSTLEKILTNLFK